MENNQTLPNDREWGFQDYMALAIRRKWIILSVFVLAFSASVAYFFTRPPVYETGSTFIIENTDKNATKSSPFVFMSSARPFGFYETLVKSRIYRERIVEVVQQDNDLLDCQEFDTDAMGMLLTQLAIAETEHKDLYTLAVKAHHPVIAYRFAVIAINEFKRRCQEIELEESRNVVSYVNVQIEEARKNLERAERDLQEFKERNKMSDVDQVEGGLLKKLTDIESELEIVQTQRQLAQANLSTYQMRFSSIKQTNLPDGASGIDSPDAQRIRSQIDALENEKRKIIDTHGISSPKLSPLENRIETKKNDLRQAVLNSRENSGSLGMSREGDSAKDMFNERIVNEELTLYTLNNKEQYLRAMIERYRVQNPNILEHAIELSQLQRTKKVNESLYTFLVEKAEEAKINAATGAGGIRVVDEPSLPQNAKSTNAKRNLAVALILSLGLGFGLAFVRDYLDNSVYTVEDIRQLGDFPILGNIPVIKTVESKAMTVRAGGNDTPAVNDLYFFEDRMNGYKNKVISMIQSKEPLVDAYRHVRTNLQFANVDVSIKRVLVTSSIPAEGKTLTAANLAISFAELGKRILVVDCDMRKPHQHVLYNVRKSPGLSDYLARDLSLEKVIYLTHVPNVYVIPAGTTPPNPAEMLASNKMSELIRKLEQNFDFVVYDTPPIIAVTDPVLLSKKVGNVVMVVRFGKTSKHLVRDAVGRLNHVKSQIVGVVFNGMERSKGYGYYNYDYSYYQNTYYTEDAGGKKRRTVMVG